MRLKGLSGAVAICVVAMSASLWGDERAASEMRSLDDQVQQIKSDVLEIAAELNQLEEQLLFPSNTQVTIFIAMEDASFRMDSVRIGINDELATHHIYSFKELEALRTGGVQRIFMGNIPVGAHQLEVAVLGQLDNGSSFDRSERFEITKEVEPSLIGITVAPGSEAPIRLQDW